VEISPNAASSAQRKGLNVVTGDMSQASYADNSFDIITVFETIENIFDLKALFSEIKRILKPEGLLVMTTPDAFSYGAKTGKDNWVGAKDSLEHIYYLGRKSLKGLLDDTGCFSILILASAGLGEIDQYDTALVIAKKTTSYRTKKSKKRILFVGNDDILFKHGGATIHLLKTKEYLEKLGLEIQVDTSLKPNPLGFDLVHIFGSYKPEHYLPQMKWLKQYKVPILLTPIYLDFSELIHVRNPFFEMLRNPFFEILSKKSQEKDKFSFWEKLKLSSGKKEKEDVWIDPPKKRFELYPEFDRAQKEFFQLCDYLLPNSYTEIEKIRKNFGLELPFSKVPVAVDEEFFRRASQVTFKEKYKISDFVLCVGSLEFRKNQLMVILALKDTDLPLVLIGSVGENEYYEICKRYVSNKVTILHHLSPELLASAYINARVHVLASWQEVVGLTNLEAALAGCNIVVSDRSSEKEYFGESAYYCNPASSASIRDAVLKAWSNYEKDKEKRTQLQRTILKEYNWQEVANQTLKIYEIFKK
jgi:glycosyltransferase involved in cell wall biosynthesis